MKAPHLPAFVILVVDPPLSLGGVSIHVDSSSKHGDELDLSISQTCMQTFCTPLIILYMYTRTKKSGGTNHLSK